MAQLSREQQAFLEVAYDAAHQAGLYGPQADLAVAQAVHETGWGRSPSGVNNYHGIKDFTGKGTYRQTWEVENGRRVNRREPFANFKSLAGSFKGWRGLMERMYPGVMAAKSFPEAVRGLNIGNPNEPNYATDPKYAQRVSAVQQTIQPYAAQYAIQNVPTPTMAPREELDVMNAYNPQEQTRTAPAIDMMNNMAAASPVASIANVQAIAAPAQSRQAPSSPPDPSRFGPAPSLFDDARFGAPAPLGIEFSPSIQAAMEQAAQPSMQNVSVEKGARVDATPTAAMPDPRAAAYGQLAATMGSVGMMGLGGTKQFDPLQGYFREPATITPPLDPAQRVQPAPSVFSYPSVEPTQSLFSEELSQKGRSYKEQEDELESLLGKGARNANIGRLAGSLLGAYMGGPVGAYLGAMMAARMAPNPAQAFFPDPPKAPANRGNGGLTQFGREAASGMHGSQAEHAANNPGGGLW